MSAPASAPATRTGHKKKSSLYGVKVSAVVRCPLENIPAFRQQLVSLEGKPFPAAFLKPSDEQTIVAVAAVLQAVKDKGLEQTNFAEWGVIAAPRFMGRLNSSDTIYKFEVGGAWKAPPLFVAHRSMHAISGTISQALQCKGPNFGVGGGLNAVAEGLLTALTLLEEYRLPGLWLVLTQCDPEPRPDFTGVNTVPAVCHALALAFTPVAEDWPGLRLSLIEAAARGAGYRFPAGTGQDWPADFNSLTHFLEQGNPGQRYGTWSCALKWGCELQLTDETEERHSSDDE